MKRIVLWVVERRQNMNDRCEVFGGRADIESAPGAGPRVVLRLVASRS